MSSFEIVGGKKLFGEVDVPKSKNSFLPILSATLLCEEKIVLHQNPKYADIFNLANILRFLGKTVTFLGEDIVCEGEILGDFVPQNLSELLRSSIFVLGPILATKKHAKIALPGGCKIGKRPIDLHLFGLKCLGVKIKQDCNFVECDASKMHSGVVDFRFPSVGATENILMASVFLDGTTTLNNPAKEPEIVDLANFLNKMGANIKGAGTNKIVIVGTKSLHKTSHTPIPDRIFAGTMLIASAVAGGEILLKNVKKAHLLSVSKILRQAGFTLKVFEDKIVMQSFARSKNVSFTTLPYPGFATDLQSQMMALLSFANGTSKITETVFETRFGTAKELQKMGADIKIMGQTAFVKGKEVLHGAKVFAGDLRGGAGLVLAGLGAEGTTQVENIFHIDRGYFEFEKTLQKLGANIRRI